MGNRTLCEIIQKSTFELLRCKMFYLETTQILFDSWLATGK